MIFEPLKAIPAFYAELKDVKVPFVVTVTFVDKDNQIRLTPAVESAINKIIDITGREGLVTVKIPDDQQIELASKYFERCVNIPQGILLFHCWSDHLAEQLMTHINEIYAISMITQHEPNDETHS